jgi:cyanophycinase
VKKQTILFIVLALGPALAAAGAPKGRLFIIGGGNRDAEMTKQFIALSERVNTGRILVFPMAGATPAESGADMVKELKGFGAKAAEFRVLTREQAEKPEAAAVLDGVGGVYFTGGDQARVTKALLGTPVHRKLLEIYENGAVIGGTSAGAAIMSEVMITGDEVKKPESGHEFGTIEAGNVITTPGMGFIKSAVIDQHFATRKRHNRLISVLAEHPALLGVGIDESTAIIVGPDETFKVVGEKNVFVYDPGRATFTIGSNKAIGVSGLTLHVLLPGAVYDLKTRTIKSP